MKSWPFGEQIVAHSGKGIVRIGRRHSGRKFDDVPAKHGICDAPMALVVGRWYDFEFLIEISDLKDNLKRFLGAFQ